MNKYHKIKFIYVKSPSYLKINVKIRNLSLSFIKESYHFPLDNELFEFETWVKKLTMKNIQIYFND